MQNERDNGGDWFWALAAEIMDLKRGKRRNCPDVPLPETPRATQGPGDAPGPCVFVLLDTAVFVLLAGLLRLFCPAVDPEDWCYRDSPLRASLTSEQPLPSRINNRSITCAAPTRAD